MLDSESAASLGPVTVRCFALPSQLGCQSFYSWAVILECAKAELIHHSQLRVGQYTPEICQLWILLPLAVSL